MGRINLNEVKKALINEDQTFLLLDQVVEEQFGKFPLGSLTEAVQELVEIDKVGSGEVSESLVIHLLVFNTQAIFKLAESPIEKIFLNTLNILSFPYREVFFNFTHDTVRVDVSDIDPIQLAPQEVVVDFWKKYQKLSYKNTISGFLDMMVEAGIGERQVKRALLDLANYYIAKLYGLYYITLQPSVKSVEINGKTIRADIYIWSASDERFKLIVECDGYSYHSDKASFSQDRKRDRLLHMKGFKVLRFSGSDIVNNPVGMARELKGYLVAQKSTIPLTKPLKKDE